MSARLEGEPSELVTASVTGASSVVGAVFGTLLANNLFNPNVELINQEGETLAENTFLYADVSLNPGGSGASVTYGDKLDLPNIPIDLPIIGDSKIDIHITSMSGSVNEPESLDYISSLIAQYDTSIVDPVQNALIERLATGATIGSVIAGYVGYKAFKKYREIKPNIANKSSKTKRFVVAGACATLAIAGFGGYKVASESNEVAKNADAVPLPKTITNESPLLKGATVTGIFAKTPQMVANLAVEYIKDVDSYRVEASANFVKALDQYQQKDSKFYGNPNYTTTMHMSDAHCNSVMYDVGLAPVSKAFKPSIIFNTGDTFTNGKTMPYEKNCFNDLRKAVRKTERQTLIINAIGNHDPKNPINIDDNPKVVTPTKYNNFTVETVVGSVVATPDKSKTTWKTSPPEDTKKSKEMSKLTAKQGSETAKIACDIANKTGDRPIVMVHRPIASYYPSATGCPSLILKGHTHKEQLVRRIPSITDDSVLNHTAGSSSGSHNTISIYENPRRPAAYTMLYFDKARELVGSTTVTFNVDASVTIKDAKVPAKTEKIEDLKAYKMFLDEYHK